MVDVFSEPTRGIKMNSSSPKLFKEQPSSKKKGSLTKNRFREFKSDIASTNYSSGSSSTAPRFFIMKRKDSLSFSNVSPFVIEKFFTNSFGSVSLIKKVRDGLLIGVNNDKQSAKLSVIQKFQDYDVEVFPHPTLNYSRGVVTCRDLLNCSEEEILENLHSQNVIALRKIRVIRDGQQRDTASYILTFNTTTLPNKIKAGFHSLTVRPYIPPPMRCYRCQKFGHVSSRCSQSPMCECGSPIHEGEICPEVMRCVNCGGDHSAKSRTCPVYLEESAIQKIKVLERLSYSEARERVRPRKLTASTTYAQATSSKGSTVNAATIREITTTIVSELSQVLTEKINAIYKCSDLSSFQKGRTEDQIAKFIPKQVEIQYPSTIPGSSKCKNIESMENTVQSNRMEVEENRMEIDETRTEVEESIDNFIRRFKPPADTETSEMSIIKSPKSRSRTNSFSSDVIPPIKKRTTDPLKASYMQCSIATSSETENDEELFSVPNAPKGTTKSRTRKTEKALQSEKNK